MYFDFKHLNKRSPFLNKPFIDCICYIQTRRCIVSLTFCTIFSHLTIHYYSTTINLCYLHKSSLGIRTTCSPRMMVIFCPCAQGLCWVADLWIKEWALKAFSTIAYYIPYLFGFICCCWSCKTNTNQAQWTRRWYSSQAAPLGLASPWLCALQTMRRRGSWVNKPHFKNLCLNLPWLCVCLCHWRAHRWTKRIKRKERSCHYSVRIADKNIWENGNICLKLETVWKLLGSRREVFFLLFSSLIYILFYTSFDKHRAQMRVQFLSKSRKRSIDNFSAVEGGLAL